MASTSNRLAHLLQRFSFRGVDVSVYISYDILSNAPIANYDFLLVPANEALVGTRFPYFPVGGPVPYLLSSVAGGRGSSVGTMASSRWGGMDKGENMMYPVQCLDGIVHAEAGSGLLTYLQSLPEQHPFRDNAGQIVRCPVGHAVLSPSFGLSTYFSALIHTVPPFSSDENCEVKLLSCYSNSFRLISASDFARKHPVIDQKTAATVLLGTGTRGIPIETAARVATRACAEFQPDLSYTDVEKEKGNKINLHFVLRDENECEVLLEQFSSIIIDGSIVCGS